jgi:hypothetical protein
MFMLRFVLVTLRVTLFLHGDREEYTGNARGRIKAAILMYKAC